MMMRSIRKLFVGWILLCLTTPAAHSIDWSQFKDPEDGQLDISNWLLERGGVPISHGAATEPEDRHRPGLEQRGLQPSTSGSAPAGVERASLLQH